jgi:VWFA-related protein
MKCAREGCATMRFSRIHILRLLLKNAGWKAQDCYMKALVLKGLALAALLALTVAFSKGHTMVNPVARARAQGNINGKLRREKFGSSLKRLKWDASKKAAVEASKERGEAGQPQSGEAIKLTTLLVVFDVAVVDATTSEFITGLTKDDFIVMEKGVRQQISTFSLGDGVDLPRRILLILDTSGSQRAYLDSSLEAARTLVNQLAPKDEMAIATDDVEMLVDFTPDKAKLASALDLLRARRRATQSLQFTTLFAALREVFGKPGLAPRNGGGNAYTREIVIFQTDGDEAPTLRDQPDAGDYLWNMPRRQYGLSDIYRAAERSSATIYTVIPSEQLTGLPPGDLMQRGRKMLVDMERSRFRSEDDYRAYSETHPLSDAKVKLFSGRFAQGQSAAARVAELTGGWTAYLERPDQAAAIYSRIQTDINHRYVIGYYPANTAHDGGLRQGGLRQGELRQVQIQVAGRPNVVVRGRASYYAPD